MTTSILSVDSQYGSALTDAIRSAERALMEARIPIHILLTTKFGDLNDNQEEMVGAAASALDRIAEELVGLKALTSSDQRVAGTEQGPVRIGDILRGLQGELRDQAARIGASLALSIEPGLPHARGDDSQLRDAIRLTLIDDIRFAAPGTVVEISVRATPSDILVSACSGPRRSVTGTLLLAERILAAQGAHLELDDGHTVIAIPRLAVR